MNLLPANMLACDLVSVPVLRAALKLKVEFSTVRDEFAM